MLEENPSLGYETCCKLLNQSHTHSCYIHTYMHALYLYGVAPDDQAVGIGLGPVDAQRRVAGLHATTRMYALKHREERGPLSGGG